VPESSRSFSGPRYSIRFVVIAALFVTCLLIANIIAVKIVELPGGIITPAGVVIFPLSYLFGDVLTEVYGYAAARKVIWLGFFCNLIAVLAIAVAGALPAAPFWQGQAAYETILGFTPYLLIASFCAYLVGEFLNSFVLARMKVATNGRWNAIGHAVQDIQLAMPVATLLWLAGREIGAAALHDGQRLDIVRIGKPSAHPALELRVVVAARRQRRQIAHIDRDAVWIGPAHDRGANTVLDHLLRLILHFRQRVLPDHLALLLRTPPTQHAALWPRRDEARRIHRQARWVLLRRKDCRSLLR